MPYSYTVESVERQPWAVVARNAVLRPILGLPKLRFDEDDVQGYFNRVFGYWSNRLATLKVVGWAPIQTPSLYATMLNCPPFGVRTDRFRRPCRRHRICPFCYARQVCIEPWFYVRFGCYRTLLFHEVRRGERVRVEPLDCPLLEFSSKIDYERPKGKLKYVLADVNRHRHDEVKSVAARGAFVNQSIEVFPEYIRLHRRGLILSAHGQELEPTENRRVWFHPRITHKVLVEALGRVCRYPVRMLRGDAAEVAAVLRALEGVKMAVSYGCFRNSQARAAEMRQLSR